MGLILTSCPIFDVENRVCNNMKKERLKKPTWVDVKKTIKSFECAQLIEVIRDLYQLSAENKTFLDARFLNRGASLLQYKKIILNCLYHDVMDENDDFDFSRADKAIEDYAKATYNIEGTVDLMIYYVECGNRFTLDYGDINESFYDTLIEMYKKAIDSVLKMPKKKQGLFRKRLEKVMESSDGIGWGYHDDLCNFYYEAFQ